MPELVGRDSIAAAAATVSDVVVRTPLVRSHWLEEAVGGEVRLKCENLQRAGAFKIRGAYTMMSRLRPEERERGVITYSSGNHAQGVALAAKLFNVAAVVVMPTTASRVKLDGARRLGAEVILEGTTSTERRLRAEHEAEVRGLAMVPAFDHPDIIAGQGTVAVELLEDWPDADTILVPIGGGGLAGGVAAWTKQTKPDCRVIGVEPENAAAMSRSIAAGRPVTIDLEPTIADGLMPVRPGDLTFEHARAWVDDIVLVSDDEILEATARLLQQAKLVVEFSGAATTAALLAGHVPARRCAVILSGGNLDSGRAMALLAGDARNPATR